MRAQRWALALAPLLGLTAACGKHQMTESDCRQVLLRLTTLELEERGFRDPELARRRAKELRTKLADDIQACVGRSVGRNAMACVERATTVEAISHECLH